MLILVQKKEKDGPPLARVLARSLRHAVPLRRAWLQQEDVVRRPLPIVALPAPCGEASARFVLFFWERCFVLGLCVIVSLCLFSLLLLFLFGALSVWHRVFGVAKTGGGECASSVLLVVQRRLGAGGRRSRARTADEGDGRARDEEGGDGRRVGLPPHRNGSVKHTRSWWRWAPH